jgi:hypothetical protein
MFIDRSGHQEDGMMKTIFNFSSVIVCLISLVLLVPIAGVQETQAAENQERSQEEITAEKGPDRVL